jgi:hypothetical protein
MDGGKKSQAEMRFYENPPLQRYFHFLNRRLRHAPARTSPTHDDTRRRRWFVPCKRDRRKTSGLAPNGEDVATPTPHPSPQGGGDAVVRTGYIVDRSDRIDG